MNRGEHTRGPWLVASSGTIYGQVPKNNDLDLVPVVDLVEWGHGHSHTRPNAHLISAAPDMLAALQAIIENLASNDYIGVKAEQDAMDAIRKATGRDA